MRIKNNRQSDVLKLFAVKPSKYTLKLYRGKISRAMFSRRISKSIQKFVTNLLDYSQHFLNFNFIPRGISFTLQTFQNCATFR